MTSHISAGRTAAAALAAGGLGIVLERRAAAREAAIEARFPPVGDILDVDGVAVHAVVSGSGPDVVLLHGAGGNVRDFTFGLMPKLARRYRVIAFDRPGLGYSGRVREQYDAPFSTAAETPREQGELLVRAARLLGAERPVVAGHSFGGTIALAWACWYPEAVSALALIAAASNRWPGGLGPLFAVNSSAFGGAGMVPLLTAFGPRAAVRTLVRKTFAPDPVPDGYGEHLGAELALRRRSLRANARQLSGLKPHIVEMEGMYPDLALPIERVHGDADRTVPAAIHVGPFQRMVPRTNLVMLPEAGHMPHHSREAAVIAAIDRAAAAAAL